MLATSVTEPAMPGAVKATLDTLDDNLNHLSPALLTLTQQLFDVLAMPVTRGPLTGVWGRWENASPEQIQSFLQRWHNSSLSLLKMGHGSLVQLVMMSWYECPQSWGACGYPGPPNSGMQSTVGAGLLAKRPSQPPHLQRSCCGTSLLQSMSRL